MSEFLVTALVMGIIFALGFLLLYWKLPIWCRKILSKHVWITDIIISVGVFILFAPRSVTGLFMIAIFGICVSAVLSLDKRKLHGN